MKQSNLQTAAVVSSRRHVIPVGHPVIPAQAGIQRSLWTKDRAHGRRWMPAFASMTTGNFAGMTKSAAFGLLLIIFTMLPACAYTARGKVVEGAVASVEVIHNDDPRSRGPGIANVDASIQLDLPPGEEMPKGQQHISGRQYTTSSGEFTIRLHQTNEDWKHHKWQVNARKRGYQSVSGVVQMPPNHTQWTILVTMPRGASTNEPE